MSDYPEFDCPECGALLTRSRGQAMYFCDRTDSCGLFYSLQELLDYGESFVDLLVGSDDSMPEGMSF